MPLEEELSERVLRRAVHLIPQPQTALRVQRLIADPNYTLPQVVDAVRQDPLLAAAVLRIANSAALSRGGPVTGLAAAVTRIGERDLARLALACGLGVAMIGVGPLQELRRRAMQDALTSALVCERIAPAFGLDPESLFLEGLLHDVGGLVALGTLELIVAQQPSPLPLAPEAWLALAQKHHVELGGVLCEKWQLPVSVYQVIVSHHEVTSEEVDAATVVRWSDVIVGQWREGAPLVPELLPWFERVPEVRRAALSRALTEVPAMIAAFDGERVPSEASRLVSTPSLLPPSVATSEFWFPARLSGGREGHVLISSATRLMLKTTQRVPDNHVAQLEIDLDDGEPLSLWVRVTFSGRPWADGLFVAEATPFAPSKAVWNRLQAVCSALALVEVAP